jgi:hypothetical protein
MANTQGGANGSVPMGPTNGRGGGGGTGAVNSVTGVAVDNTDPANPVIDQQFNADVTVPTSGDPLALELVLTTASHISQWAIKTLIAAATQAVMVVIGTINGNPGIFLPAGNALGLSTDPANFTGFVWDHVSGGLRTFISGTLTANLSPIGLLSLGGSSPGVTSQTGGTLRFPSGVNQFGGRQTQSAMGTVGIAANVLTLNNGPGNSYAGVGANFNFITTTNWTAGSQVTVTLPSGTTVGHNVASPPANSAPILMRAGVNLVTTGTYYLLLQFDGTNWVQLLDDGVSVSTAFGLPAQMLAEIQSGTGLTFQDGVFSHFTNVAEMDISVGTGPFVPDAAQPFGCWKGPSGNGLSSQIFLAGQRTGASNNITPILNPKTEQWAVASRCSLLRAPVANENIGLCSLSCGSDEVTLYVIGTTSTTVLQLYMDGTSSGGGLVIVACNATGTIGNGNLQIGSAFWNDFAIARDPVNDKVYALLNGVVIATMTPGANMTTHVGAANINIGGGGSLSNSLDADALGVFGPHT